MSVSLESNFQYGWRLIMSDTVNIQIKPFKFNFFKLRINYGQNTNSYVSYVVLFYLRKHVNETNGFYAILNSMFW